MTENLCNRCRLNAARDHAREHGLHVSIIPEPHGDWDRALGVYAHPIDVRWDHNPDFKVAWLTSVTDLCSCGKEAA